MPVYRYNAMDPSGRAVVGTLEADSLELVRAKLADLRYHVLNIRETRARAGGLPTAESTSLPRNQERSVTPVSRNSAP